MNARSTSLLASLALVIATGCAPATEAVDEEATQEGAQEIRGALGDGVVSPREYVGPVNTCPAGWELADSACYQLCRNGYHPVRSSLGWRYCAYNGAPDRLQYLRSDQELTCASNLEYINGSCYRRCPAGSVSRGILGCEWGGQAQRTGSGA